MPKEDMSWSHTIYHIFTNLIAAITIVVLVYLIGQCSIIHDNSLIQLQKEKNKGEK